MNFKEMNGMLLTKCTGLIFKILLIVILSTAFIGCNPENRQNSIGREDSVRGRSLPASAIKPLPASPTNAGSSTSQQSPAKVDSTVGADTGNKIKTGADNQKTDSVKMRSGTSK